MYHIQLKKLNIAWRERLNKNVKKLAIAYNMYVSLVYNYICIYYYKSITILCNKGNYRNILNEHKNLYKFQVLNQYYDELYYDELRGYTHSLKLIIEYLSATV